LNRRNSRVRLKRVGFKDAYVFDMGSREHLHRLNNLDEESIIKIIEGCP
jgi:transketolase